MKSMTDIKTEVLEKGHYYVDIALDEVVFFIRPEKIVPYTVGGQYMEETEKQELKTLDFVTKTAEYELYEDDGYEKDYENPKHYRTIKVEA